MTDTTQAIALPLQTSAEATGTAVGAFRVAGRGRVNPTSRARFTFDGRRFEAYEGDTVASALLAHGVHLMGRSFKYHRPRGVVTAGSEEPNALLGIRRGPGRAEPNVRATMQEVFQGLETISQNRSPSLVFDVMAVNDLLSPLFSAGFYYKTFMWPRSFWNRVYEPVIRAAAGLGRAPSEEDPDCYAARYHHCDVLVVGAGPAGLAAALAAARSGARVTIADEHAEPGGSLLSEPSVGIGGRPAWGFLADSIGELAALPKVRLLPRTTAVGYFHQNMVALAERVTDHLAEPPAGAPRERLWRVRAGQVVLAQGAIERPLVFPGNDRPGVMLAGAAQTYLNRFGVLVGRKPVVVTSHDSAYVAAFDLADAGVTVAAIVDARPRAPEPLADEARRRGIEVLEGHTVTGTGGRLRVSTVRVAAVDGGQIGNDRGIPCDCVLVSGGWTPSVALFSHTKGALAWDEGCGAFVPGRGLEACAVAGAGAGRWGIAAALRDGAPTSMPSPRRPSWRTIAPGLAYRSVRSRRAERGRRKGTGSSTSKTT